MPECTNTLKDIIKTFLLVLFANYAYKANFLTHVICIYKIEIDLLDGLLRRGMVANQFQKEIHGDHLSEMLLVIVIIVTLNNIYLNHGILGHIIFESL